jgi:hypothetical protein
MTDDARRNAARRASALAARDAVVAMLREGLWGPQSCALILQQWSTAIATAEGSPNPVWPALVRAARAAQAREAPAEKPSRRKANAGTDSPKEAR